MKTTNERKEGTEIGDDMLIIDVRGIKYKIPSNIILQSKYTSTLTKLFTENPDKELYINRNSAFFELILDYHVSGVLHLPDNLCLSKIKEELQFWNVSEERLALCCWSTLTEKLEQQAAIRHVYLGAIVGNSAVHLEQICKQEQKNKQNGEKKTSKCLQIWNCMEDPLSCHHAKVVYHKNKYVKPNSFYTRICKTF